MINLSNFSKKQRLIGLVIALILLLGGGFLFRTLRNNSNNPLDLPAVNVGGAEITVHGYFACLPYVAPAPSNPDCVLGIMSDSGLVYGLDTSSASAASLGSDITPEDLIYANGLFVSLDEIPGEEWKKFSIEGVIRVERFFVPTTENPEPPFTGPLQNG